ncbi:MAG: Smr/MutS family protein [Lewinellaceae bacterium]|nr:Smr/MutS family protein [Lewinellaceae bacterium]
MILYPSDIRHKLEFDKIIESIKTYCLSSMAKAYFDQLEILDDVVRISNLHNEVDEYKKSMERSDNIPMGSFEDVREDVVLLKKEGYVLEIDSIGKIYHLVSLGVDLTSYFEDREKSKTHPILSGLFQAIIIDRKLVQEIDRILDEEGNVRPDASEALLKITKQIKTKEQQADRAFNIELEVAKSKGFLIDSLESIRNGRKVLTVAVEHKRKIPGLIHDESATGKTVFIEPESVMQLNNDVYNLIAERRHEIYKILRELCAYLRPFSDAILAIQHVLTKVDTIRAKAIFALAIGGGKPYIQEKPVFDFRMASNPVLVLKSRQTQQTVIPFDIKLFGDNRLVVLSGPNAGGKSVALKSVGLLQLMVQSGIPVSVDENSVFGIFTKFFVDIGDQQSIDDDLSTYSSHLSNMKFITENADGLSLVLIDEFGSGTDPKIGGSIAESILKEINHRKVFGVITTHYSNLKYFAYKNKGIVNGSMEFDRQHLKPTFRLHIGKPGSSFAFEIADKIGLDKKIINNARKRVGESETAIDDLLGALMDEKREYENKFTSLIEKQDRLDKLMKSYEQMKGDLDIKKKKLKLQAKEQLASKVTHDVQEIQKLLSEVRKSKDEEKLKSAALKLREHQSKTKKELHEIKKEVFESEEQFHEKLAVGSHVRMRNGTSTGEIISMSKDMAEVNLGTFRLMVPIIDLVLIKEPIEIKKHKSVNNVLSDDYRQHETKIDIREYTKSDALYMLQEFMDKALVSNAYEVKIIHGIGTGVLKNEVKKLLRQYKDIKEIWHPHPDQGGEGVTLVKF